MPAGPTPRWGDLLRRRPEPCPYTVAMARRFPAIALTLLLVTLARGGAQADSEFAWASQLRPAAALWGPAGRFTAAGSRALRAQAGSAEDARVRAAQLGKRATLKIVTSDGHGTGFLIDPSGLVVTNAHVVEPLEPGAEVELVPADPRLLPKGTKLKGKVLAAGGGEVLDLAFIQLDSPKTDWPALPLGETRRKTGAKDADGRDEEESLIAEGQGVLALGFPQGYGFSVTQGIVSGLERWGPADFVGRELQTSAAINSGNSGGPLLALDGRVIGVNTSYGTDAQNVGFAIIVEDLKLAWQRLARTGSLEHGSLRAVLAREDGRAVVRQLLPGGAAERAGLRVGDAVDSVDGIRLAGEEPEAVLAGYLRSRAPGDVVLLGVAREGLALSVRVALDKFAPAPPQRLAEEQSRRRS